MPALPEESTEHFDDIEASQALLSEHRSAAEPLSPTASMAPNPSVQEARTKSDTVAGTVALTSVALLTVSTWAIIFTHHPSALGWFAPHPLLQTLGLTCFTYGIYTLQPTSFADPRGKEAGLTRHQIFIFCLGLPSILLGTWSIWHNKNLAGKPHFTTWHGTFGIACVGWMLFQVFLGVGSVWFKGALFGGGLKAKGVWKYHRLSGYILFPLFFSTIHIGGGWSDWAVGAIPWELRFLAYTLAPALVVAGIFWRVRTSKMKLF